MPAASASGEKAPPPPPTPTPPPDPDLDGGWAWVIAVGVCVINIVTLGSIRCLGILVNNASVEFSVSKRDSSLIFSITYVTLMLSTTLVIGLTRVVSCRVLIFVGGILISGGLCLGYFLPTPTALASGTAVLLGLGLSASQSPAILLLNRYFDRYRTRANGVAFAGGPIGSFLMPPLLTHLMQSYAFRGAMLLWGGLALHVCAAACLMRPKLPPQQPPQPQPAPTSAVLVVLVESPNSPNHVTPSGPAYGASLDDDLVPYAEDGAETVASGDYDDDEELDQQLHRRHHQDDQSAGANNPQDPLLLTPPEQPAAGTAPASKKVGSVLSGACNMNLFRRPLVYVLGVVLTVGLCGLPLSFYIVPLHGRELGLDSTTTSLFLLLQGVPDLVSRLLAGFLTDKKLLTHLRLCWLALLAQSALWFILLATPSYGGLLFFATACGLVGGIVTANMHPLAISQLGLDNYPTAYATYSVVHGCWMLCLPILLGTICDRTQSWRLAIAFVGFLLAVAGATGLVLDMAQSLRALTHRVVGRLWRRS